jgi:hypothetical protein
MTLPVALPKGSLQCPTDPVSGRSYGTWGRFYAARCSIGAVTARPVGAGVVYWRGYRGYRGWRGWVEDARLGVRADTAVSQPKPVMMLARWNNPARLTNRGD